MKISQLCFSCLMVSLIISCNRTDRNEQLLSLHPENPHYFNFRGKPVILIGSTEHYGAVMNLDFDYISYLDELDSDGLNISRTFSGVYVEPQGAFRILKNTLAPAPEKFICPWARSKEPGYALGGNKFDLSKWDRAYFSRLKDFITQAGKRNIIVELDLFSNYYDTIKWKLSPLYSMNNINMVGRFTNYREALAMAHNDVIDIQEKMVRKIVNELKDFDNLYYEICNEPYFGDTAQLRIWQEHMTNVVVEAEKEFKFQHLISNNISNKFKKVSALRPGVSIYNFHYAHPPVTVDMNYGLDKVIGDNETGFNGIENLNYRAEAWNFILAGGGLFNNLDYSFTTDNEDGSFIVKKGEPGGGGKTLRNQFKILAEFMNSFDFINMTPAEEGRVISQDPETTGIRALSGKGDLYAIYIQRRDTASKKETLNIDLSEGSYSLIWVDTKTADKIPGKISDHQGGVASITSPAFSEDIALEIRKIK